MKGKEIKKAIKLKCLFCFSESFVLPSENYTPFHGSFVVCANCGRENDFTFLLNVGTSKAEQIVEEYMKGAIEDASKNLKKMFKNNKLIKIR